MLSASRWVGLVLIGILGWPGGLPAADVKVLSAGATRTIVTDLSAAFQAETGHTLTVTFGTAAVLRQKQTAGEPWDVVIVPENVLAVHQISEIVPVKGVTLVGPLPRDLQKVTVYSAGLPTSSPTPEMGRAFIRFLTVPAFTARLAAAGLDYQE